MSKDQVNEVSSWVHNECKCVSIGSVSQSLGLSRSQAAQLLGKVPNDKHSYRVTKCVVSEEDAKGEEEPIKSTVFKLVTEDLDPSKDLEDDTIQSLYALSLADDAESLLTAHERDMAHLRDMMRDNNLDTILSNCTDLIAPAPAIVEQIQKSRQELEEIAQDEDEKPVSTIPKKSFSRGPKKATSVANFFGKIEAKKTSKSGSSTKEDEKENISSKRAAAVPKKNNDAKAAQKKNEKVGNADDFVGDVEDESDDDDDDAMDVEPTKKPAAAKKPQPTKKPRARKRAPKAPPIDEDDDEPEQVSGAMDAFATEKKKPTADGTKHKRRRKKLVEKTTKDKHGYLHTETQEVWEDIPSDEEEQEVSIVSSKIPQRPVPAKKTKTSASGKTTMKQGNLMGFFTKKK